VFGIKIHYCIFYEHVFSILPVVKRDLEEWTDTSFLCGISFLFFKSKRKACRIKSRDLGSGTN
jgi:hypothetical protein